MSDKNFTTLRISTSKSGQFLNITDKVSSFVGESGVTDGICFIFIPHTTAAVTINENADPDVLHDMLMGLENMVPDNTAYKHAEGNSTAHIRSSIIGNTQSVIVKDGELLLGTWQGIYFCEFDGPRSRKICLSIR